MDTTVETGGESIGYGLHRTYVPRSRVENIGLMARRQNALLVSGFVLICGTLLVGFGELIYYQIKAKQNPVPPSSPSPAMSAGLVEVVADATDDLAYKAGRLASSLRIQAKRFGSILSVKTKAAVQFTIKQAELTKIAKYSLPNAYYALGTNIYQSGRHREELGDIFREIDVLMVQIRSLKELTQVDGEPNLGQKLKAAALHAKDNVTAQTISLKTNGIFRRLGEATFANHGNESGLDALVAPILRCRSRMAELETEISSLEAAHSCGSFTPKRIAFCVAILSAIVVLLGIVVILL